MSKGGDSSGLVQTYIWVRVEEDVNKKLLPVGGYRRKVGKFMKLKKILFSLFCVAILLCTGVVCLASADNGGISTYSTSDYSEDASYNGVSLRIRGYSSVPASISQIVNPSSTNNTYFGEVAVIRSWASEIYDEDGDNKAVASGKVLTASIGQNRDGHYFYEHDVILHAGYKASTPIVKKLIKGYGF